MYLTKEAPLSVSMQLTRSTVCDAMTVSLGIVRLPLADRDAKRYNLRKIHNIVGLFITKCSF
jgi:hypothetical protein